ncbi:MULTISPECIES: helix-turn-helix domain-containing protein [unclassified Mycobacterium]|uniref:helix-turn-helix transcriptional regulator n=1 Tax=unclassified Mycobacterium TaxID=2642494 RepID=UPI000991D818
MTDAEKAVVEIPPEDTWLTRAELSVRNKISPKTLAQWSSQGRGPKFYKFGGHVRYRLSDVIAWENAQATGGSAA